MRRLILLLILALQPRLADPTETEQFVFNRLLSGVDGNQVHVTLAKSRPLQPIASFVSVCLSVPGTQSMAKGVDTETSAAQFARPDHVTCISVAPMMQRIVLLTQSGVKSPHRSMAFTIDLTGMRGRRLDINWITEAVK